MMSSGIAREYGIPYLDPSKAVSAKDVLDLYEIPSFDTERAIKAANTDTSTYEAEPEPGVVDAVRQLADDYKIQVVGIGMSADHLVSMIYWLTEHDIPYDEDPLLLSAQDAWDKFKKDLIDPRVRAFITSNLSVVKSIQNTNPLSTRKVIMLTDYRSRFDRGDIWGRRVGSWGDIVSCLK